MSDSDDEYPGEGSIRLAWGGELRFPSFEQSEICDYVRVVDGQGKEVAYWTYTEWEEDGGLVMGAIMGLAQNGLTGIDIAIMERRNGND